jgi:antitoxin component YwqK of YwqJK toxin-antitoxin module
MMISIFVCVAGCFKKRIGNESLVVERDGDGHIQSEIHYINDSIKHGTARYYDRNGKLREEIDYKNGLKDGWIKIYYPDGKMEGKGQFKDGLREGLKFLYYDNEKLKEESNWLKDRAFGNAYFFYKNGKIETFNSYDFHEHNRYLIKYDSNGAKLREEGTVLGQLLLNSPFDSVVINKEMIAKISVAVPPERSVKVVVVESKGTKMVDLPVNNNLALYTKVFAVKGKQNFTVVGEMTDKMGNVIKRDSISTVVLVIEDHAIEKGTKAK